MSLVRVVTPGRRSRTAISSDKLFSSIAAADWDASVTKFLTKFSMPMVPPFARKSGLVRHFWIGERGKETADPGQDPRDAPDMSGLWVILETTPWGRGTDWYPKLRYETDTS